MIIDLKDLESGSSRPFDFSVPADKLDLETESARLASDLTVKGELKKSSAEVDVTGTIDANVEIDCSRCLKPVPLDLKIDFNAAYVSPEHFAEHREHEVSGEDLDTDVLTGDELDLTEIAREQILLNLPEQAFCTEDCKGLCPICGGDRNLIDCKCEDDKIDPRWSALKDLK